MVVAFEESQSRLRSCFEQVDQLPAAVKLGQYIWLGDGPAPLEYLANPEVPSEDHRALILDYADDFRACRKLGVSEFSVIDPRLGQVLTMSFSAVDDVSLNLVGQHISWGEANQVLPEIKTASEIVWNETLQEISNELAVAHQDELDRRAAAFAAAAQWNYQQQQLNNQQQMLNALTMPRTTNCQAFGNTVNCTTW